MTIKDFGAFLKLDDDNELDIFLPLHEQITQLKLGQNLLVMICFDAKRDQYYASQNIDKHLQEIDYDNHFHEGQEVTGVVYAFTPLGAKVAVNKTHVGLVFKEEVFQDLHLGSKVKAYIKSIREDGRLNLALQKQGYLNVIGDSKQKLLAGLRAADGKLPFNDKSSSEAIRDKFHMSKTVFKQALGALYKQKRIKFTEDGIELVTHPGK